MLPFTNRSGLPEDEVFAIGMVEDVIDALSQGVHVRVIASSTTAHFRGGAISDLGAMARQLGVRYLLEGNVRRAGSNLRVTSQLVEVASGAILWTQKFERPLSELAALQEDLVIEVAANLDAQVYRIEMQRALRKPADLTAWEAVTRSFAAYRQFDAESVSLAIEEAKRALAIAPDYGLAHAMFAMANSVAYALFGPDDPGEVRRTRGHADRALALDPDNALVLAHVAIALVCIGQPEAALHPAERAVRLSPSAGWAYFVWGSACCLLGRCDEALQHFDAELRLSPVSHMRYITYGWQAYAHTRAGRWQEAAAIMEQALVLNPAFAFGFVSKAVSCSRDGHAGEARDAMMRVRQLEPEVPLTLWERRWRWVYLNCPALEEILQHLRLAWTLTEPDS